MTELSREKPEDINIKAGDDASKSFYEAAKLTYSNQPDVLREEFSSFSGLRSMNFRKLGWGVRGGQESDGIGTKVEIAERVGRHDTIAFDLMAMICDDAAIRGGESLLVQTVLDVNTLGKSTDPEALQEYIHRSMGEIATGYAAAANAAGVVISGGETAELGDRVGGYGPFNYNWGGTALWAGRRSRLITGKKLRPGDTLIGFAEHGFRSNGITNVRQAMLEKYGDDWHNVVDRSLGDIALGELALEPSTVYSGFMTKLTGGYRRKQKPLAKIHAAAHITGGGQPSKIGRMLEPTGLGVEITNPIAPPNIMLKMQEINGYDDRTAYGKWHMGPGMVIATPEPDAILEAAQHYGNGIELYVIGRATEKPGIRTINVGAGQDSRWLEFNPAV
ncbi:MAG: Phosphoribosylformylglycinamidine cyclo-ligase [Candidatus Saccharibacteria bacterium]|nr:Phosphoribosylformylglycinamidine cyclo-ligase [Candidatus Saccharibacteria bacterium]